MQRYTYRIFKKFNTYLVGVWVMSTFIISSCTEIIEPDLSKKGIQIIAPTNNLQTNRLAHTFLWEDVEGAESYTLQIASPGFNQVQRLVLNESLTDVEFDFTLSPGNYQWRVRAENNGSKTSYKTYSLFIDSTLELNGTSVVLEKPLDDFVTNDPTPDFSWFAIDIATKYTLSIKTPDFNGSGAMNPIELISNSHTLSSDLPEGNYEWSVKASNEFSESNFATPRSITIDLTNPEQPTLNSPLDGTIVTGGDIQFSWNRPSDDGSSISDSLCVFSNSSLTQAVFRLTTTITTYQDSLEQGKYYWYVRSIDAAGNLGNRSNVFDFTIQ